MLLRTISNTVLLAALCGWFYLLGSVQAQLIREWSFNLFTLGWGAQIIIDDSGSTFVFSYSDNTYSGARFAKIKTDGAIGWQTDYPVAGLQGALSG
jgi:hypothetical protein